jgi:hypothetical protein
MKRLLLAGAAGLTTASTPAAAQEAVHLTVSWLEVTTGTNVPVPFPNGTLEPGESARFSITAAITPAIGSTVTYTPPPPPGTGTLAGLGAFIVDLTAGNSIPPSPSGAGSWSAVERAPGWAIGDPGSSGYGGALFRDIQAGQLPPLGATANSSNPVNDIWRGVWTPAVFSDRLLTWTLLPPITAGPTNAVLIQYGTNTAGNPLYVAKFVIGTYGSTTIPIIPAPASILALSALFLQRRRRGS